LRHALRECVDQAFTDHEARSAGDNELRPQEQSTQVIAADRHRLKVFRAKGVAAARREGLEASVETANGGQASRRGPDVTLFVRTATRRTTESAGGLTLA
jgi:hypothetical protein